MAHEEAMNPAQAPNLETNTAPIGAPTAEKIPIPTGSEHVKQTKYRETAMGDAIAEITIPDGPTPVLYDDAHFVENMDGFPETFEPVVPEAKNDKNNKKPLWITVGAGIGALAVAGAGFFALGGNGDKSPAKTSGDSVGNAAPALPGQEGNSAPLDMYNTDITHEDYGRQLNVTLPYLQEHRAQSMKEVSDELDLENRVNTIKASQLPTDPALLKAQNDQNNITADLWTISKESNTILARNLLNSVFWNDPSNGNDAYDLVVKQIGNGKGKLLEPTSVIEVSPTITEGTLGGVRVNGQPSYIAQVGSRSVNHIYEEVISERYSQDGKSSSPVVVATIQYGEPEFVMHPSQSTTTR